MREYITITTAHSFPHNSMKFTRMGGCISLATEYGRLVELKLVKVDHYDNEGQFDISEKLTVTMNSLWKARSTVVEMLFEVGAKAVDDRNVQKGRGPRSSVPFRLLAICQDELDRRLDRVQDAVLSVVYKEIVTKLRAASQVTSAESKYSIVRTPSTIERTSDPLFDYLDANLKVVSTTTLFAFDEILSKFWDLILRALIGAALSTQPVDGMPVVHLNLLMLFDPLYRFFYQDGDGLSKATLEGAAMYARARKILDWGISDVEYIIAQYYTAVAQSSSTARVGGLGFIEIRVRQNLFTHLQQWHPSRERPLVFISQRVADDLLPGLIEGRT